MHNDDNEVHFFQVQYNLWMFPILSLNCK